jgi:hypothetical protein
LGKLGRHETVKLAVEEIKRLLAEHLTGEDRINMFFNGLTETNDLSNSL